MYFRYSVINPWYQKIPGIPNQEAATNVVLDLLEAIDNPAPTTPFESIELRQLQAIRNLADFFKQTAYEREDHFSFQSVKNKILNKKTQ